jgi:hypothetical protein
MITNVINIFLKKFRQIIILLSLTLLIFFLKFPLTLLINLRTIKPNSNMQKAFLVTCSKALKGSKLLLHITMTDFLLFILTKKAVFSYFIFLYYFIFFLFFFFFNIIYYIQKLPAHMVHARVCVQKENVFTRQMNTSF